jgi:hypothetical protein
MFGKISNLAALSLFAIASTAGAVDVTVNSTQPETAGANYQTIKAALTYVSGQPAPRTVRVTGGGPYVEAGGLAINFSVTVKGDGFRPVVATEQTAGQPHTSLNGNGVSIFTTAASGGPITVRLENLVIIPSTTNTPSGTASKGIRTNNNATGLTADVMNVELVDVLVTSNNGSNQPVTTDGLSQASMTGATPFGDDGVFISGLANLSTTGTIVSNIYGVAANTNDGIVFNPDVAGYKFNAGPGTVVSYMNRIGIQVARNGSIVDMAGTATNPVLLKGNWITNTVKNPALALFNTDSGVPANGTSLKYVVFQANNATGVAAAPSAAGVAALTADHVAFDSNQEAALYISQTRNNPWTFTNTTFVNNALRTTGSAFPQIMSIGGASSTGTLTFTNSVIAGNGSDGNTTTGANLIEITVATAPVSFVNCSIPTVGPYKVGNGIFRLANSAPVPTQTNVINSDPKIQNVGGTVTAPGYLAVQGGQNDNAGTGGSDLSGYGPYTGPPAGISEWNQF